MGSCAIKQQIVDATIIDKQCSKEDQNEETSNVVMAPPIVIYNENIRLNTAEEDCDILGKISTLQIKQIEPTSFSSKIQLPIQQTTQSLTNFSGYGIIQFHDGSHYEGHYDKGLIHGYGKLIDKDGNTYIGEWLDNKKHGYGKETIVNQYVYQGWFKDDMKSGKGYLLYSDGSFYEGQFEKNNLNGYGIYKQLNGLSYEGEWNNNQMEGQGKLILSNSSIYLGEFKSGKKNGYGIFSWPDGKTYEGTWKDDIQHGEGHLKKKGKLPQQIKYENGKRIDTIPKITSPNSK